MSSPARPLVGIVMGSDSDWPVMRAAAEALAEFSVPYEVDVVSAHRMPQEMLAYGEQADGRGLRAVIAGAGGAAHLGGLGQIDGGPQRDFRHEHGRNEAQHADAGRDEEDVAHGVGVGRLDDRP